MELYSGRGVSWPTPLPPPAPSAPFRPHPTTYIHQRDADATSTRQAGQGRDTKNSFVEQ